MYHIKNDSRSIRSSQMLYRALASLIRVKPFNKITVTDLVKSAKVGRTTFYRNFDEMEDVLRMQCDATLLELRNYILAYVGEHDSAESPILLRPILDFFYQESDIIELIILAKRKDIIQDSVCAIVQPYKSALAARHGIPHAYLNYAVAARTGMLINILVQWVEDGKSVPPEELAKTLEGLNHTIVSLDRLL